MEDFLCQSGKEEWRVWLNIACVRFIPSRTLWQSFSGQSVTHDSMKQQSQPSLYNIRFTPPVKQTKGLSLVCKLLLSSLSWLRPRDQVSASPHPQCGMRLIYTLSYNSWSPQLHLSHNMAVLYFTITHLTANRLCRLLSFTLETWAFTVTMQSNMIILLLKVAPISTSSLATYKPLKLAIKIDMQGINILIHIGFNNINHPWPTVSAPRVSYYSLPQYIVSTHSCLQWISHSFVFVSRRKGV